MGKSRICSAGPRDRRSPFVDALLNRVLLQELFAEYLRNLPELPEPEDIDFLRLQKAGEGVLFSLYSEVGVFADHYQVPGDLLWDLVVDWVVADHMGTERTPAHLLELLIPEKITPEPSGARSREDDARACPSQPLDWSPLDAEKSELSGSSGMMQFPDL
jgi:hypothetical protein